MTQSDGRLCARCGTPILADAGFCGDCGNPASLSKPVSERQNLTSESAGTPSRPEHSKARKSFWTTAKIIALVLIAIAATSLILLRLPAQPTRLLLPN